MTEEDRLKREKEDWAEYEAGRRVIQKVFKFMCEHKPSMTDPSFKAWDDEMKHLRRMAVKIGDLGHAWNFRRLEHSRKLAKESK